MNTDVHLTPRESEVAELLAWGAAKKEVANMLGLTTRTVENFARSIFEKAEVNSIGAMSAWWFCRNYPIPVTDNPIPERMEIFRVALKHKLMAIALFAILVPKELINHDDLFRTVRRTTIQRTIGRTRRNISNDYLIEF